MALSIRERIELARTGDNAQVIARLRSGWLALGDWQLLRGYCVLLSDPLGRDPDALPIRTLNELNPQQRGDFMLDWTATGDALLALTDCCRLNYEILGNVDPTLHAHVFPRYYDEPEEMRPRPVWGYDWGAGPHFDSARDTALMANLRQHLRRAGRIVE